MLWAGACLGAGQAALAAASPLAEAQRFCTLRGSVTAACVEQYLPATGYTDEYLRGRHIRRARIALEQAELDYKAADRAQRCSAAGLEVGKVTLGMGAMQVRDCGWGAPHDVRKSTTAAGVTEFWHYLNRRRMLTFHDGRVVGIDE